MKNKRIFAHKALLLALAIGFLPLIGRTQEAVPRIELESSLLTSDGELSEHSLPTVLAKLHAEHKLNDIAFDKEGCLKAKNIRSKGGYQTKQLFLVTSTCKPDETSLYIVKEPAGEHEIHALKEIERFAPLKDLILPKHAKGLPAIALPIAYFAYHGADKIRFIEVMPRAKGEAMSDVIASFRDDQSPAHTEKIGKMFRKFGEELSAFHKRFMKANEDKVIGDTITHQDLHVNNAFYDEVTGEFTFIDDESMLDSLNNPNDPWKDIVEPFVTQFTNNFPNFAALVKGIDLKTWANVAVKNFVLGYLKPYKSTEHQEVLHELKTLFNDYSVLGWAEFDEQQLKHLKDETNLIFDQLITTPPRAAAAMCKGGTYCDGTPADKTPVGTTVCGGESQQYRCDDSRHWIKLDLPCGPEMPHACAH